MTGSYKYLCNRAKIYFQSSSSLTFCEVWVPLFVSTFFSAEETITWEINIKFRLFALVVCLQVNWPIAFHSLSWSSCGFSLFNLDSIQIKSRWLVLDESLCTIRSLSMLWSTWLCLEQRVESKTDIGFLMFLVIAECSCRRSRDM